MHEHLRSIKQNPTQKFCKNLINFEKKKTQNLKKPKNLGLKIWNAWRKRDNEIIPVKRSKV